MRPGEAQADILDFSSDLHPLLGPAVARVYLQIIQKYPAIWQHLYDNESVAETTQELSQLYGLIEGGRLRAKIGELSPDVIVCAHAFSFCAIAYEKAQGHLALPVVAVITDFGVHTYWTRFGADLYLVPTEILKRLLLDKGVPAGKIRVTGLPIHPAFAERLGKARARKALGVEAGARLLLLSGGSKALGGVAETLEALLGLPQPVRLVVVCGNNQTLFAALNERYRFEPRVRVEAELPPRRMRELMEASDLLVGKAGGLTCAEALALGLPMVLFNPIPGQEERNSEYLISHRTALRASSLPRLKSAVAALLKAPGRLGEMSARARALGRPDSARRAVKAILALLK